MYYYIADPPQSAADQKTISAIRAQLIPEGIPGEFVFRTPGGSAAKLAQHAVTQGFTTIICIGADLLVSEVASVLYDSPTALGVIPVHASSALHSIIGYSDWKVAIQALRHRRLVLRDIGSVNGEMFFLTPLTVRAKSATMFLLHMDRFTVSLQTDTISISLSTTEAPFDIPGVINFCVAKQKNKPLWIKPFLGQAELNVATLLRSEQAVIQSDQEAILYYEETKLGPTPVSLAIIPQAVRMIVQRQGSSTAN